MARLPDHVVKSERELRGVFATRLESFGWSSGVALGRLLAVAENSPQLRANEQFNRLMDELAGTENRVAVERMRYNEQIQEYNTVRRQFPANVTARGFIHSSRHRPTPSRWPKVNFRPS